MRSFRPAACLAGLVVAIPAAGATFPTQPARAQAVLGNFACYEARFSEFASRWVTLTDVLGSRRALVGRPDALCFAARVVDVRSRTQADTGTYLTCHPIRATGQTGGASVQDKIGPLTMTLQRPVRLCVASSIAREGVLRPPPATIDHFTCYSIRPREEPRAHTIVIKDEFGQTTDSLVAAKSLCVPGSLNASPRVQSGVLTCYEIRSAVRARTAVVRSLFGLLKASLGSRQEVCLRSDRTSIAVP